MLISVRFQVSAVPNAEIKSLNFVRSIRDYELRIEMKTGAQVRLCGFRPSDRASLRSFVKDHYAREVGDIDLDVKGHSWGTPTFQENTMKFVSPDGGTIFSIPLSEVSQATQVNKTEVGIELRQDDSLPRQAESLIDIRFVVPEQPVAEGGTNIGLCDNAAYFNSSFRARVCVCVLFIGRRNPKPDGRRRVLQQHHGQGGHSNCAGSRGDCNLPRG